MHIKVGFTADFICPWCFIGERRLFRAVEALPSGVAVEIDYRPFELNPQMPPEGIDRRTYRTRKFGSLERSEAMDARVAAVAKAEGIVLDFANVTRTPSTLKAHRLMRAAAKEGKQRALGDRLFLAYFSEGRDLSDGAVLRDLAAACGMDRAQVDALLASDLGEDEVRALEREADDKGFQGVPVLEIGDMTITGAQPVATIASALRRLASPRAVAAQ